MEETIVDLTQTSATLEQALGWVARGCARRLTTPERLRAAFARRKKLRWRAELAGAVADVADGCNRRWPMSRSARVARKN